eukprot:8574325-Heterocapsa_arctica.AAC.1
MACAIVEETNVIQPYKTLTTVRPPTTSTSRRVQALVQNDDMDDNGEDDDDIDVDIYVGHDHNIVNKDIANN